MSRTVSLAFAVYLATGQLSAAVTSCDKLRSLTLPGLAVTLVEQTKELPGSALVTPICRVAGEVKPAPRSDIHFEVWIPSTAWNNKYVQLGNGGFAGRIPYLNANEYLRKGYAVGVTDDGHTSADFTDARWALGGSDRIRDFAFRAIKRTHDASMAVLRAYSRHVLLKSYFVGCSNGGREALQAAQMFPRDFDGIIAGAPAANITSLLGAMGLLAQYLAQPGNSLPAAKLPAVQRAALAACGGARGYVTAIEQCHFDPGVLACSASSDAQRDECLFPGELAAVHRVYDGFYNLSNGERLPGPTPGAEALPGSWQGWIVGAGSDRPSAIEEFSRNFYAYFLRQDPNFSVNKLTMQDVQTGHERFGALLDAANPDLTAFAAHGGKLLQYHGGNDPGIPVGYSTTYFRTVQARIGDSRAFYRLFLVPGMLHCGGGNAPSEVDWLGALEAWAERGKAPDALTARWPTSASPPVGSVLEQRLSPYYPTDGGL